MKYNVFFLLIDSLREDEFRKFCISHPNSTFTNLSNQGTYFSNCISSADATLLSLSSIFTGLYPNKTGIRSEKFNQLSPNVHTFFQNLQLEHYNFYGYYPTVVDLTNLIPKFKNKDSAKFISPCITNEIGKNLISNFNDLVDPWFLYLHCMDLHEPIVVPKNLDDKQITSTYQKQIMAIDKVLGDIIKKIDFSKTIFILCSDHGTYLKQLNSSEDFIDFTHNSNSDLLLRKIGKKIPKNFNFIKEKVFYNLVQNQRTKQTKKIQNLSLSPYEQRNLLSQKFNLEHNLFDELIKIPLIFSGGEIPKNKVIENQIRSVDIFPTLLSFLKIKFDEQYVDGQNLTKLISGDVFDELVAYFETNPLLTYKSFDSVGLRLSDYKYFRDKEDPQQRIHLYDLKNDPFENNNICEGNQKLVIQLENRLQKFLQNNNDLSECKKSELIENELKKLGYV